MLKDETVKGHYIASKKALVAGVNGQLIPQLERFETKFISQLLAPFNFNVMKQQARCWQNKYSSQDCANINEVSSELHAQMSHFSSQANWDLKSTLKGEESELVWYVHNTNNQKLIVKSIEGIINQEETTSLERINDDLPMAVMPGERARISFDKGLTAINVSATLDNKKSDTFSFIKNVAPLSFIPRGNAIQTTNEHEFIEKSEGIWHFKPGTWQINQYLVTPPNTQVTMPKGTRLEFSRYGGLMVFGQIQVNGTMSQPVVLTKQSDVKKRSGLSVFSPNTNTTQTINNLQISYASSPKLGLWQPRGAIYFVHGKVNIQQLSIADNMSEDGLNIINAEIDINGLTIRNALSDAFDCDFCQGTVRNSQFSNIGFRSGGDGLDVSGSKIKLINARFNNVRDKAISGGERSHLNVKRAHFENVNFGLIAKDDTTISAAHITARNVQYQALMSYSKKPIFGAAQMQVDDFQCLDTNCIDKISVEIGSILNVNGQYISPKKLDVKKIV